jgi:hypothetical protein
MTGANSGRNRQPLDWPMIQVGAARLSDLPARAVIEGRGVIAVGYEARGGPQRCSRLNRNSEAIPLKSRTL